MKINRTANGGKQLKTYMNILQQLNSSRTFKEHLSFYQQFVLFAIKSLSALSKTNFLTVSPKLFFFNLLSPIRATAGQGNRTMNWKVFCLFLLVFLLAGRCLFKQNTKTSQKITILVSERQKTHVSVFFVGFPGPRSPQQTVMLFLQVSNSDF